MDPKEKEDKTLGEELKEGMTSLDKNITKVIEDVEEEMREGFDEIEEDLTEAVGGKDQE